MRAYKTEIDPTPSQIELIHKTFGCTRYIYNQFVLENLENLASDKDYISAFDYSKRVNNDPNTPIWLKEVPSKAVKQALLYADRAFKDYFYKRRGKPKFKKKGLSESFYLIGTIKVERHRIFVPVLKWIRLKEFGYIPKNITSVTISMKNGRYYISCLCKDEVDERISLSDYSMGIDLFPLSISLCVLESWSNVYEESRENFLVNMKPIWLIRFITKLVPKRVSLNHISG